MERELIVGGTVVAVLIGGIAILRFYERVKQIVLSVIRTIFHRSTLFWWVTGVFMVYSSYHAAPFYAASGTSMLGLSSLKDIIGLSTALVIDLVVIVFMQARLRAFYKRDYGRMRMFLWFIVACCAMNTIANLYTNYEDFQVQQYHGFWSVAMNVAPSILSVFPLFIILISRASEEMSRSNALEEMNVEEYEQEQQKRLDLLAVQVRTREQELAHERTLLVLAQQQKENERLRRSHGKKERRSLVFSVSFFGAKKVRAQLENALRERDEWVKEQTEERARERQAFQEQMDRSLREQEQILQRTFSQFQERVEEQKREREAFFQQGTQELLATVSILTERVRSLEHALAREQKRERVTPSAPPQPVSERDEARDHRVVSIEEGERKVRQAREDGGRRSREEIQEIISEARRQYPHASMSEIARVTGLSKSVVSRGMQTREGDTEELPVASLG